MRIEYLYRYPVKGLTAEALEAAEVERRRLHSLGPRLRAGAGRLRIRSGAAGMAAEGELHVPDEERPDRRAVLLLRAARRMLAIRAPDGSAVVENALTAGGARPDRRFPDRLSGRGGARHAPRSTTSPGHSFCDQRDKVVSLINLASLRDYEAKVGARRHRRRFRANVWFSGAAAWSERDWVGRQIQVGGAVLRVTRPITRCPATEVNPETAERDADPVAGVAPALRSRRTRRACRGHRGRPVRCGRRDRTDLTTKR